MPKTPSTPTTHLHAMAVELAAMCQNGLEYSTDSHDIARYQRLREMTAELLDLLSRSDERAQFETALSAEAGHALRRSTYEVLYSTRRTTSC